jgi:CBS domain-containing protein
MLKDIVNRDLVTIEPHETLLTVARLMEARDVGCVLVLNLNGKPRGLITDRDLVVRCVAKNLDLNDTTVENVLTESLVVCNQSEGFFDCIKKMRSAGVRRIPVVDDAGKAVGIVSFGDLMAVLSKELYALTETTTPLESIRAA